MHNSNLVIDKTKMSEKEINQTLIGIALDMRERAYVPYSDFRVGAALMAKDGQVYTGCNIENAAFTPTNCAERTAFFKAISEGKMNFDRIAIVGGRTGEVDTITYPCAVCRQVMVEFTDAKSFKVIVAIDKDNYKEYYLEELLPFSFGPNDLTF